MSVALPAFRHLQPALRLPARLLLSVLAGLLLLATHALHPLWWAPWLLPVPLLAAASGTRRQALLPSAIASVIGVGGVVLYLIDLAPALLALLLVRSLVTWIGAVALTRFAAARLKLLPAALVLPATVATFETLLLTFSIHGAAGSLAYSQMDVPLLIQTASLGGVPMVAFLTLLPGSLLGLALTRSWPPAQLQRASIAIALVVVATLGFGAFRLAGAPAADQRVALIATDRLQGEPRDWTRVWSVYQPSVARVAAPDMLIVLPEKIALLDEDGAARAASDVAAITRGTGATIVLGIELQRADGTYRNRALVVRGGAAPVWYDKQRMVPHWEDRDVPGDAPLLLPPLGVAICKDMHVPAIGRQYAGRAALLAVPAWDFDEDGWMGARMTAMRAVENGYAIARSARRGLVGAYDRTGRVVAEQATGDDVTVVTAQLSSSGGATLYGRVGDWFGWLCAACIATLVLLRLRDQRQEHEGREQHQMHEA